MYSCYNFSSNLVCRQKQPQCQACHVLQTVHNHRHSLRRDPKHTDSFTIGLPFLLGLISTKRCHVVYQTLSTSSRNWYCSVAFTSLNVGIHKSSVDARVLLWIGQKMWFLRIFIILSQTFMLNKAWSRKINIFFFWYTSSTKQSARNYLACMNKKCTDLHIWHWEDCASWYILVIKANKMHYFSNLFW